MRLLQFLKITEADKQGSLMNELAPVSPEVKAWFGNSKVVGKDGNPLLVFHATYTPKAFGKLRGLTHFGSHGAASDMAHPHDDKPTRFYPVYLKIENPLLIRDTGEGHDAYEYANSMGIALDKIGMTKEATLPIMWSLGIDWNEEAVWKYYRFSERLRDALEDTPMLTVRTQSTMFNRLRTWKRLRMIIGYLEGLGFDGFTYTNEVEDPGSVSWVPFRSSQVRYAYSEGQLDEGILDVLPPGARQLAMAVAMLSVLSTAQGHESSLPHPSSHPSVTRDRDFSERLSAIADFVASEDAGSYGEWTMRLSEVYKNNPEEFKRLWGVDYDKFLDKARNSTPQEMAQYMKDVAQSFAPSKVKEGPEDFDAMAMTPDKLQQSLNYFYTEHAPGIGKPKIVGTLRGNNVVVFNHPSVALYFLVDKSNTPNLYLALTRHKDGMAVGNVRSNGSVRATDFYDYILNNVTPKLYSDDHQTPEGRKLWQNFERHYDVTVTDEGDRLVAVRGKKISEAPLQDFEFVQSSGRLDTPASRSFAPVPKRDPVPPEMRLRGTPVGGKSTRKADWAYLTDPRLRARTFKKFDKTPHNFKVAVYDTERSGTGRIFTIPDWQNFVEEAEDVQYMMDFKPDPNAINIIYTNNQGANAVPFSPWIMMHRFSHMYDFNDAYVKVRDAAGYGAQRIMKTNYTNYDPSHKEESMMQSFDIFRATSGVGLSGVWANYVWDFFNSIGNFKSARKSNMTHAYEFFTELMPQYVLTGSISFRPAPEEILYRGTRFGDQETALPSLHPPMVLQNPQQANQQLVALGEKMSKLYETLLASAVGKVHML